MDKMQWMSVYTIVDRCVLILYSGAIIDDKQVMASDFFFITGLVYVESKLYIFVHLHVIII